jgi:hypothetical protein
VTQQGNKVSNKQTNRTLTSSKLGSSMLHAAVYNSAWSQDVLRESGIFFGKNWLKQKQSLSSLASATSLF